MKSRYALTPILTLAALLTLPAAAVHAGQPGPGNPGNGQEMTEPFDSPAIQQELKLTAEQKQKVKALHEEARAKHEAIRKETHDKMAAILTPEQMKKFEERRGMMMDNRQDRRGDRMEKRMDKMKERQQPVSPAPTAE